VDRSRRSGAASYCEGELRVGSGRPEIEDRVVTGAVELTGGSERLLGGRWVFEKRRLDGSFLDPVGALRAEPFLDIPAPLLDEGRNERLAIERFGRIAIEARIEQAQ